MSSNHPSEPPAINPKRLGEHCTFVLPTWRRAVFPIASGCVAAAGVTLMVGEQAKPMIGLGLIAVGVAAGGLFHLATQFLGRLQVHLDRQGMTVVRLWSTRRYRWGEVSDFSLIARSPGRSARLAYVAFNAEQGSRVSQMMNRLLTARSQVLPVGLVLEDGSGDAAVVVELLNAWRDRALGVTQRP